MDLMPTLSLGNDSSRSAAFTDALATDSSDLELVHGTSQQPGDRRLPRAWVRHVEDVRR